MRYTYAMLTNLAAEYGDAFYVLDVGRFTQNYNELLAAFRAQYEKTEIAYSYKTNYIPALCRAVNALGGYAEVVSHMEFALARRIGVAYEKIVFNGPYKQPEAMRELMLSGGTVHLDSLRELELVQSIARENPDNQLRVGIRVNFPIGDGVVSRFGFDSLGEDFQAALQMIRSSKNINMIALHCHFASRALETWKPRAEGMCKILLENGLRPERIDLGGGMFGRMDERLKAQFAGEIPSYQAYAQAVGEVLHQYWNGSYQPVLMLEPGSALVGDCMDLVAKVHGVKTVRGQTIATVLASTQNIQMGSKTPPVDVVSKSPGKPYDGKPVRIVGYTCIEGDVLAKEYPGQVTVGDYAVFRNVGSYSIVLKPPFILPNIPVLSLREDGTAEVIKRAENERDVFQTYFTAEADA